MEKRTGVKKIHRARKVLFLILAVALPVAVSCLFFVRAYRVVPVSGGMVYEYGTPVSEDLADYLEGTAWSVRLGELDLSGVDVGHTGTYQAVVRHGSRKFDFAVSIQDTVAPEILWRRGPVYLALGRDAFVRDVIEDVRDADGDTAVYFRREGGLCDSVRFDGVGEYELEILAIDTSGNESGGRVSVIVDTPPEIEGVRNFYVTVGSRPDYLDQVTAGDDTDGSLTDRIRVEDAGVFLEREGEYTLKYIVEDSCGLVTESAAKVLVASEDGLQAMIGRRLIDYRRDVIIGAPNIYDAGISGRDDLEEALEYLRPALVQLYHSTGRGGYSSGSGYIMEISEDRIYICTNRHVVNKYEDWSIYFFDGTGVPGRALGFSEEYDVGVAAVERKDVPEELLRKLMTVHIDRQYWESLDEQPIELALERIDREGGLIHYTEGNLVKIRQSFDWYNQLDHTEVTVELVHGDSGSAVVDGYGNLICMAYAYSTTPTRYWCVPLDGILSCYQEITGRMPYVYETGFSSKLP